MKPKILFIDDDRKFIEQVSRTISVLNSKAEIISLFSVSELNAFLKTKDAAEVVLAIIDNHLDGRASGKQLSDILSRAKINHILLSGDCSIKILESLKKKTHCISVYEKKNMPVMIFQLVKAIENAEKNVVQIRNLQKNNEMLLAQGILMARYNMNDVDSKRLIQKHATKDGVSLRKVAQKILDDQDLAYKVQHFKQKP